MHEKKDHKPQNIIQKPAPKPYVLEDEDYSTPMAAEGEMVLYQPDETVKIDVRVEDDTVWLTQAQIAELFQKDQSTVARHINNAFKEEELDRNSNMHFLHNTLSKYKPTAIYDLDVIISVGYRVHSKRGTQFRIWARNVLKEHMLQGYTINTRMAALEDKVDRRLAQDELRMDKMQGQIDFFIQTSLPPRQGIFFDGQVFDAYTFVCDLVRSARQSIVLIDNYCDDTTLKMLDNRADGVLCTLYTPACDRLAKALAKHNAQYPTIEMKPFDRSHDRYLCVDDCVYHVGASLKDLGKRWFSFSLLGDDTTARLLQRLDE